MVKIKRKVEMTQEEYAKYMIDKYGVSGFESELIDDNIIDAPKQFTLAFELNPVPKSDLLNGSFRNGKFTIDVEEEITEDTVLPMIIECDEDLIFWVFENTTLKNLHQSNCEMNTTKYYRDKDGNMHLIWRDGKLVE